MNRHQIDSLYDLIKSYSYCAKNGSLDKLLHISDNSYLFNILNNLEFQLKKQEGKNNETTRSRESNQRNDR